MVQNIIKLSEKENRIINMVKARHGMRNKNQALGLIIQTYARSFMPAALRPIENTNKTFSKKRVSSVEELRKKIRE